ncbi:MAG TPA: TonB-dependent receptor, partial [Gemmatimonadales bacterium]
GRHEYGAERLNGTSATPVSAPQELSERGAGLTLTHAPSPHWRQTLIAGHHWISGEREPATSLLLTPRLPLGATHETAWRSSVRYSSTFEAPIGGHEGSLAAGAEYSRRHVERAERRLASSRDLRPLYDEDLKSTGGFGQVRLRLGTGLILSGGTRAEWPSSVGENSGPSWASTAGATWSHPVGRSLLRLRAAWGRGIRPPEPGMSRAMAATGIRQEANPELAPETQTGVEAGVEVHLNDAFVARATWYHQQAEDLIQQVPLRTDGTERVYQFQNLGAIRNRGVELEAGLHRGPLTATGALYLNRSTVSRLAPSYSGFLRPGDELPEIPEGVGALRLRYQAGRVSAEVGGSWLGSWIGYDWAAALGTEPARASDRDYWIEYSGGLRPWIATWLTLGGEWRAFARIDNPGNTVEGVRTNVSPPIGRSAVVGVELKP